MNARCLQATHYFDTLSSSSSCCCCCVSQLRRYSRPLPHYKRGDCVAVVVEALRAAAAAVWCICSPCASRRLSREVPCASVYSRPKRDCRVTAAATAGRVLAQFRSCRAHIISDCHARHCLQRTTACCRDGLHVGMRRHGRFNSLGAGRGGGGLYAGF